MEGGSRDSYSPQVHNLYPHVQPTVYPPPANPQGQAGYQQYQTYFGEEDPAYNSYYGRSEHPPPPAAHSQGPFQHVYQDDADCITFLRGCFAGLCCCCLLEQCCIW